MISTDQFHQALKALQRLIIHCKAQVYNSGDTQLGALLNDIETLPEFLADERDRTDEFIKMLQGIAQVHPSCRYIVEEFERASTPVT